MADTAVINHLCVWVRFSMLPVEYYTQRWLERAGNKIGRTLKVDDTALIASRGVCNGVCGSESYQTTQSWLQVEGEAMEGSVRRVT